VGRRYVDDDGVLRQSLDPPAEVRYLIQQRRFGVGHDHVAAVLEHRVCERFAARDPPV
jgi:hypothetical protein